MIENAEVESLRRRLQWEGAGSLAELSNWTRDALTARGQAIASWGGRAWRTGRLSAC